MGCGGSYVQRQPDVLVQGTGVEPLHCYIENVDGVVTLYPLGEMTSVDGQPVVTPVRLTQGMDVISRIIFHAFLVSADLISTISSLLLFSSDGFLFWQGAQTFAIFTTAIQTERMFNSISAFGCESLVAYHTQPTIYLRNKTKQKAGHQVKKKSSTGFSCELFTINE